MGTIVSKIILLGTDINVDPVLINLKGICKGIFQHISHVNGIIVL